MKSTTMKSRIALILFALLTSFIVNAQPWKSKKCAVVLTYDDALNVHLDNVIPLLDSLGLKGTFYISAYSPGSKNRITEWRKAAAHGHELGNHTLFHPCRGDTPGRSWVSAERDMSKYTIPRLLDEIRMTNTFLEAVDGKTKRSFAYTCGDISIGDSSFIPLIKNDFPSARGVNETMVPFNQADLYNVGAYSGNGQSGDQLIGYVKNAMKTNQLIVFLFHGVGGEHSLNVGLKEHRQLLRYLKEHEKEIWIAPFVEVTEYMKAQNSVK